VPVRGLVLGTECLSEVLGDEQPASSPAPRWRHRTVRAPLDRTCGWLLGVTVLATLLPWTRFSTGSGFAGAWAIDRRWSMLAAIGAVAALVVWLASARRPGVARAAGIVGGAVVTIGSLMAFWNPPPFTKPALAPWIALVTGVATVVVSAIAARKPATAHV